MVGNKFLIILSFVFVLMFSLSFSGFGKNYYSLNLFVYNQYTLKSILPFQSQGYQANLNLVDLDNKTKNISLIIPLTTQDKLPLNLINGTWSMRLSIINISSAKTEFFGSSETTLNSDKNLSVYVLPVGSIKGVVVDSFGSGLKGVKIKFDCNSNQQIPILETDSFGTFDYDFLPEGSCYVYAVYKDYEWRSKINITAGKTMRVQITMNTGFAFNDILFYISKLLFFVLLAVVIVLTLILVKKIRSKKLSFKKQSSGFSNFEKITEASTKDNSKLQEIKHIQKTSNHFQAINPDNAKISIVYSPDDDKMPEKLRIIYDTLKDKEKEIIRFLIKNNRRVNSSKIGARLSIPRTSLHRILRSLEQKKLVSLDKNSKPITVSLNENFLK